MRTALKAALSVTIDQIRGDYYGLLDQHLSGLLTIFEQDGRNEKERKRIFINDVCTLGAKRIEETPAGDWDYLDWLDDLIEGHIGQVMEIGVSFPANNEVANEDITKGFSWAYVLMNANPGLNRYLSESGWIVSKDDEATYKILRESRESRKQVKAPGEMKTPKGSHRERSYFKAAIDAGLMEQSTGGYLWKATKRALAYFLDLLYCSIDGNKTRIPNRAIEGMFEFVDTDGKTKKVNRIDSPIAKIREFTPRELKEKYPAIAALFNKE